MTQECRTSTGHKQSSARRSQIISLQEVLRREVLLLVQVEAQMEGVGKVSPLLAGDMLI